MCLEEYLRSTEWYTKYLKFQKRINQEAHPHNTFSLGQDLNWSYKRSTIYYSASLSVSGGESLCRTKN